MNIDLKNSFDQAKQADIKQQELLKREVYKEQQIVTRIMNEIHWGESKKNILFDLVKDYNITTKEFDLFYFQAVNHIKNKTKWYKI